MSHDAPPSPEREAQEEVRFSLVSDAPAPELIGLSEIAGILRVSKQRVGQLRAREDFPVPVAELAAGSGLAA